jgi:4-aminobutyrate aminotransferase
MAGTLYDRDRRALSRMQNLRFFPLSVAGGEGSHLIEADGRRVLDLSATWGAASLGHSHPAVREAVGAALGNMAAAGILSAASEPAVRLAEKLLAITPGDGERRVWLGHSGSDANETVARAVIDATGRRRILAFSGAYHGGTVGSMAVSGHSAQAGVAKAAGLMLVPFPDPNRPFRDDPSGEAVLAHIEELFATACPAEEVAAFFLEPIQADGGMIVPPPGFLARLARLCARHGILTVCDEVKVGLGRTGRLHAFEHEDFVPDIIVFGKGLGGGLPISAAVGPGGVMNHRAAVSFQTLHGNPASASAALAVLRAIETEALADRAAEVGGLLLRRLREAASASPWIGDVRGRGLAIGIELIEDPLTRAPARRLAAQAVYRAWELGAVLYYVGMSSNVLELTPPLVLSEQEAERGAAIVVQAIEDAAAGKVPDTRLADFQGW